MGSQGLRLLASSTVVEFKGATAAGEGAGIQAPLKQRDLGNGPATATAWFPVATGAGVGSSVVCHLCWCYRVPWGCGYSHSQWGPESWASTSLLSFNIEVGRVMGGCRGCGFAGTVGSATPADPAIGPLSCSICPLLCVLQSTHFLVYRSPSLSCVLVYGYGHLF